MKGHEPAGWGPRPFTRAVQMAWDATAAGRLEAILVRLDLALEPWQRRIADALLEDLEPRPLTIPRQRRR